MISGRSMFRKRRAGNSREKGDVVYKQNFHDYYDLRNHCQYCDLTLEFTGTYVLYFEIYRLNCLIWYVCALAQ